MLPVCTIGHSNRPIEEFIGLLRLNGVTVAPKKTFKHDPRIATPRSVENPRTAIPLLGTPAQSISDEVTVHWISSGTFKVPLKRFSAAASITSRITSPLWPPLVAAQLIAYRLQLA